jgi:hypothetical protein
VADETDRLDLARRAAETLAKDGYHRQSDAVRWLITQVQPAGIVEIPDTITQDQAAEFRKAWIAATTGPHRLAVLSYEWGVRFSADGMPEVDIASLDRAEAEAEVADDPAYRTLIRRTVTQRMPERGPWYPDADLATYVLTPDGFRPVAEPETPGDQPMESGESPHA